ncbi:MAG: ParA family protein [Lachnospiraceae bacterium]
MKTISGINNKGGVGKTATVGAVVHILATIYDKKILAVDIDPQGNLSKLFGFTGSDRKYSLKEEIEGKIYPVQNTIEDILMDSSKNIHDCIYQTGYKNLDIIPAYLTLSNVENQLLGNALTPQQEKLKKQLAKIQEEYDYCFIDCGPSVSLLNINALYASDEVYIPSKSDKDSRNGIVNMLNLMRTVQECNPGLKLGGCFLTQFDERKNICKEAWADCKEALGNKFLPIAIPVNTKVEQTSSKQKPLYELDPSGKATQSYIKLAEYMMAPNKKIYLDNLQKNNENMDK